MKKLTTIALAGILAASTMAATATGASAGGWGGPGGWKRHGGHQQHPHYQTYYQAPDAGGAIVAGAILGLTFGLLANQAFAEPDPYPPQYLGQDNQAFDEPDSYPPPQFDQQYASADEAHVEWCRANYRSYNEETDTFRDFQGVIRRCVAPY